MWRIAKLLTSNIAWKLGAVGLFMILLSNTFNEEILKVDIDVILANLGALLLIVGILQFLYDVYIRKTLFQALISEILSDQRVAASGICEYRVDSKSITFTEEFLNSDKLIIGVNYSARILDHSLDLVHERVRLKKKMKIVHVKPNTIAARFLDDEYGDPKFDVRLKRLYDIVKEADPDGTIIDICAVDTILRYSFISFDSRIWVIVGTNGLGRRNVPGFFVRSPGSWYNHFADDIEKLTNQARKA